ncbi:unnamed protein product (mitochondrion) [Plasmodiophora brassicae]|uniref:E3 ubiquitin protein ligase n=2 Tax=Plasmodiophora brassicae TaxID=37360 RepID=A0A3P3Y9A5_PLABS|nr:unnamed protein product [Plasmodiophora brassicae]
MDDGGSGGPSKRARTEDNALSAGSIEATISAIPADPLALLRYQNARQSEQLKEKGRQIGELKSQVQSLESDLLRQRTESTSLADQWRILITDLHQLSQRLPACVGAPPRLPIVDLLSMIATSSDDGVQRSKETVALMERLVAAVASQQDQFVAGGGADNQRIVELERALNECHNAHATLAIERDRCRQASECADALRQQVSDLELKLSRALKRIERFTAFPPTPLKSEPTAPQEDAKHEPAAAPPADESELQKLQLELVKATSLAETRLTADQNLQDRLDKMQQMVQEAEMTAVTAVGRATTAESYKAMLLQQIYDLQAELVSTRSAASETETRLHASLSARSTQYSAQIQQLQSELDIARDKLADMQATVERATSQAQADVEECRIKLKRLDELETLCASLSKELQRRCARRSDTPPSGGASADSDLNDALMAELDEVVKQFDDMQEMNLRLMQQLRDLEDCNTQLVADGSRLKQSLEKMNTEKRVLLDRESKLTSVVERHLETISALRGEIAARAALEEKLNEQLQLLQNLAEEYKLTAYESSQKAIEVQDQSKVTLATLEARLRSAETRTSSLVSAEKNARRAEEKSIVLQKQLDRLTAQVGPVDVGLERELEHYKRMVKCSVCKDTPKSVVIAKCFHIFCRPCIDTRIKNRDRRCPACSKPFGQDDVHNIYLTH